MASRPRQRPNSTGRATAARAVVGVDVPSDRGVFMISVAAELAAMHPQTLRMYEARGLIEPKRSPKGTRLYSQEDVELLRRIQEMTAEMGLNLAGVEMVLELETELERMRRRVASLERQAEKMRAQVDEELGRVRRAFRTELVPLATKGALVRRVDVGPPDLVREFLEPASRSGRSRRASPRAPDTSL